MIELIAFIAFAAAEPVVMDNGLVRVEVVPESMSITFAGLSGGANMIDSSCGEGVYVSGIQTSILEESGHDISYPQENAEVLRQGPLNLIICSRTDSESEVTITKEIRVHETLPRVVFKVSVEAALDSSKRLAIRNTVRPSVKTTMRVLRKDTEIKPLAGISSIQPTVVRSSRYWLIQIPPPVRSDGVVLGAFTPEVIHYTPSGTWTRKLELKLDKPECFPHQSTFLCLLDDGTQSYGSCLQGPYSSLHTDNRVILEERWVFKGKGSRWRRQ